MPYKRVGRTIYTLKGGKWKKKAIAKSVENAERMLRLLRALEHKTLKSKKLKKK